MMNELHAGLHLRYLEERVEVATCTHCGSKRIMPRAKQLDRYHDDDWHICLDCEQKTPLAVESFEEWAERVGINIDEI